MSLKLKRKALFPPPAHMSQAEAIEYLKRQVFEDALKAGWLRECARKPGGGSVFYAFRDVMEVSERIANREYPGTKN